jgi:hypothetical protein
MIAESKVENKAEKKPTYSRVSKVGSTTFNIKSNLSRIESHTENASQIASPQLDAIDSQIKQITQEAVSNKSDIEHLKYFISNTF